MKKIIPLLIAFIMIFGVSQGAFAETNGQTKQVAYYIEYNAIYNKASQISNAPSYAAGVGIVNQIAVTLCIPYASLETVPLTRLANYLAGSGVTAGLNALTGVSDCKSLGAKYTSLVFQLKPTATSTVTKKVKVTITQTYKRTKMWGDYFEAWYTTGSKYEVVPLSAK